MTDEEKLQRRYEFAANRIKDLSVAIEEELRRHSGNQYEFAAALWDVFLRRSAGMPNLKEKYMALQPEMREVAKILMAGAIHANLEPEQ